MCGASLNRPPLLCSALLCEEDEDFAPALVFCSWQWRPLWVSGVFPSGETDIVREARNSFVKSPHLETPAIVSQGGKRAAPARVMGTCERESTLAEFNIVKGKQTLTSSGDSAMSGTTERQQIRVMKHEIWGLNHASMFLVHALALILGKLFLRWLIHFLLLESFWQFIAKLHIRGQLFVLLADIAHAHMSSGGIRQIKLTLALKANVMSDTQLIIPCKLSVLSSSSS